MSSQFQGLRPDINSLPVAFLDAKNSQSFNEGFQGSDPSKQNKKIDSMHFESPKRAITDPKVSLVPESVVGKTSQTDSIMTALLNPLESPDVVFKKGKLGLSKLMGSYKEPTEGRVAITNQKISEKDEKSFDSETENKSQSRTRNLSAAGRKSRARFEHFRAYEDQPITPGVLASAVLLGPDSAARRRATLRYPGEVYRSVDRFVYMSRPQITAEDEFQALQKQHREEVAKLLKNKAVLEQQVELLTIQLHESSERERNLKKTYCTMIGALQQKNQSIEEDMLTLKKLGTSSGADPRAEEAQE